jgi:uridine kinase
VVIDGPSGAGKSTVADILLALWPVMPGRSEQDVQLVRLDDIYPGWDGLEAAATVVENILGERLRGRASAWQRFDWGSGERTTWHDVTPHQPLIIEGCGSLSQTAQDAAEIRVWVSVAEEIRKDRALSRGGEDFESHWDVWDQQFERRIRRENPARFANMILAAN